ncbi:PREDICTED: NEN1 [Prunus dulcis]|uniref:PREDICTED: NEN1 n=1 Tax=Prunus dulcis TaxID=3755 RepID=A0A5E4FR29_PRUDU|nr:protein NEN1-like [Prunus dulcis]VVA29949.1 PREDICTED: NEN1 [Prunus dulcis]
MVRSEDRFEYAFFDLETTKPTQPGQECIILEFGAILVCPSTLVELDHYYTLVRPADLSSIASLPMRSNGINIDTVSSSPTFQEIADEVYDILHGRIWAGHNILGFDCARIQEAFAHIGRPAPKPKGTIDSLTLLTQRFGRRAGNMKLDTLANHFGLGPQEHRSLADVRLNLEVLKYCATVLFLESSLPDMLTENDPITSLSTQNAGLDPLHMGPLSNEMQEELNQPDAAVGFLEPDEVLIPSIYASLVPWYRGSQRIKLLHDLQLCCRHMKLRFGINMKSDLFDYSGRPKLDIIADASPNLCKVLDACDDIASKLSVDSGSNSEWRPVVIRQYDYPAVRLHIPASGDIRIYATEIYKKEPSGTEQRLIFTKFDKSELSTLFKQGSFMDAFFSLDPYDYQQNAGIRLVAKKLVIHSMNLYF